MIRPVIEAGVGTAGGRVARIRAGEREVRPSGGVVGTEGEVIAGFLGQGWDREGCVVGGGGDPA